MNDQIIDTTCEVVKEPEPFKVKVGNLIRVTPGKMHGWYESNVGPIRKPLQ